MLCCGVFSHICFVELWRRRTLLWLCGLETLRSPFVKKAAAVYTLYLQLFCFICIR
jgi:hypothetical protein